MDIIAELCGVVFGEQVERELRDRSEGRVSDDDFKVRFSQKHLINCYNAI